MPYRKHVALGVGATVWALALSASAQSTTWVDGRACTQTRFQSALSIELAGQDAALANAAEPDAESGRRLTITLCDLDIGQLQVELREPGAAEPQQRSLSLGDVPQAARARVAAIAIAELVRAWPDELPAVPSAAQPKIEAPPASGTGTGTAEVMPRPARHSVLLAAPPRRVREWTLSARGALAGALPTVFYGADAAFSYAPKAWLRPGVALSYLHSSYSGAIGDATVDAFGTELSLLVPVAQDRTTEIGPFMGAAYLRSTARSVLKLDEAADTAWAASIGVRAQLYSSVTSRLGLVSSVALGHTLRGAAFSAGNEPAFGLQGILLEARLGLAVQ